MDGLGLGDMDSLGCVGGVGAGYDSVAGDVLLPAFCRILVPVPVLVLVLVVVLVMLRWISIGKSYHHAGALSVYDSSERQCQRECMLMGEIAAHLEARRAINNDRNPRMMMDAPQRSTGLVEDRGM